MNPYQHTRVALVALAGLALVGSTALASADIATYQFQLVDKDAKVGPDSIITVRLVDTKTGRRVPDAVVFAIRLDMAPDGMQDMATKIVAIPSPEPGLYRFKAKVSMAGGWRLSLAAKVQGEEGSVDNKLVIKADE
ncbi:YtkA-like protein (plasmid) [Beijerinckiaceae bacterium RH AL1]|nr:FixH family protein [Beijerinckiaceae bacterium]VVB50284.1 YtkA-like protein [Beijerinckiaceae bacterium RH CH11]VVB50293.1 YtkA-like protein [Beijerinckiaceae bacterium RH AL8]VVC57327.1 YtkA-like protein [Beijerinckiaceae bacterium RH AL1]